MSAIYPPTNTTNILVNTRTQTKVVYLPAASTIGAGRLLFIKDICGNAANSSIYISTTGRDSFDGRSYSSISYGLLSTNFQSILMAPDGLLNWMILQNYNTNVLTRPASFLPTQITGLQLWLDGSDTSSLSLTGANVTAWRDKSGNSNNTIVTGVPTIGNNINSVQSITTGTGNYFTGPISITTTTVTCFAVATTTQSQPRSGSDQRLVSITNTGTVDYGRTDSAIVLFNQSGTGTIANYRTSGPLANNAIAANTPFLATSQFNGTNALLWFNGTAGTLASSASSGTFNSLRYGVGNLATPTGEVWIGFIGEVVLYNTALTTAQRQQVEGYLAWKWGLQGSLPADHPYKNAPP